MQFFSLREWVLDCYQERKSLKRVNWKVNLTLPPEIQTRFLEAQLSSTKAGYLQLISRLKAREEAREDELYRDETKPQPWYSKFFTQPEV
jgi:hypothetical protein